MGDLEEESGGDTWQHTQIARGTWVQLNSLFARRSGTAPVLQQCRNTHAPAVTFFKAQSQSSKVCFHSNVAEETYELWLRASEIAFENVTGGGIGCRFKTVTTSRSRPSRSSWPPWCLQPQCLYPPREYATVAVNVLTCMHVQTYLYVQRKSEVGRWKLFNRVRGWITRWHIYLYIWKAHSKTGLERLHFLVSWLLLL